MGDYITLEQILEFREKKAQMQENLRLRHSGSITVALGMNIPGPNKTDEKIVRAFREGCRQLRKGLDVAGLEAAEEVILEEAAGNVAFWAVRAAGCEEGTKDKNAPAMAVKKLAVDLEENHPLGRLFDVDVYDERGMALSRQVLGVPSRRCLICEEDAKVCGRSRTHSVDELQQRVYEIIGDWENGTCTTMQR